jgi:hypothetical protein
MSASPYTCLPVRIHVCLSIYMISACPYTCLPLLIHVCLSVYMSACPYTCLPLLIHVCLSIYMSACPYTCLPVRIHVCLSVYTSASPYTCHHGDFIFRTNPTLRALNSLCSENIALTSATLSETSSFSRWQTDWIFTNFLSRVWQNAFHLSTSCPCTMYTIFFTSLTVRISIIFGYSFISSVPFLYLHSVLICFFKKIQNGPKVILWGWGETDSWQKQEAKNLVTLSL